MNDNDIKVLEKLSYFLNFNSKAINQRQINYMVKNGVDRMLAYRSLLFDYLEIEDAVLKNYFTWNLSLLDNKEYMNNPYYKNIKFPNVRNSKWSFKISKYEPYELFVCDDFVCEEDRIMPSLGYFDKPFSYPAVYENDRLWMSVTPNEINTMKKPVEEAFGNVCTIGLGLGYYTYMVSLKDNVSSITVIERDMEAVELFKKYILPQIPNQNKIKIILDDAFHYLEHLDCPYDYLFIDIWHDVSDGLPLYKKLKPFEEKYPNIQFRYWIFDTIKYYL